MSAGLILEVDEQGIAKVFSERFGFHEKNSMLMRLRPVTMGIHRCASHYEA